MSMGYSGTTNLIVFPLKFNRFLIFFDFSGLIRAILINRDPSRGYRDAANHNNLPFIQMRLMVDFHPELRRSATRLHSLQSQLVVYKNYLP
jgi:hypothetical protein